MYHVIINCPTSKLKNALLKRYHFLWRRCINTSLDPYEAR